MTTEEALKEIRRGMEHARLVYDPKAWNVMHDEIVRLQSELSALREDKERLDWLETQRELKWAYVGPHVRLAIDAARKEGK